MGGIIDSQPIFLVVDDMAEMRSLMVSNLKTLGFSKILTAQNGEEAIRKLGTDPVNMILSDLNMPQMTGLELLEWVRMDRNHKFTPFIMITAEVGRQQIEKAIATGVSDFLLKPFSLGTLSEKIKRTLNRSAVRQVQSAAQAELNPVIDPTSATSAISSDNKTYTVLVVDDVPGNLALISNILQAEYRVKVAINGQLAIKICESPDKPDLVLLDVKMPRMDGFEVIRILKSNEATSGIPVIFLSAMNDPESIVKGLEAGAVGYVTKPIDRVALQARVRSFLRFYRGYEELKHTLDTMIDNVRLREDVELIIRHDMKSPLAAIIGIIGSVGRGKSMAPEQLKTIEDLSYSLVTMLNRSIDLYKIETGRFHLNAQPVDILRLTEKVADEVRLGFTAKNIKITTKSTGAEQLTALGDELLCYSMLHNLIKNAAEAAPTGSTVFVTAASGDGNTIRLAIKNLGAVPESIRVHFFDKFVTMGKKGGTGLGTYSARMMAEAQNGSISMQTSEDSGTVIEVTLPKAHTA
ncbi:MAG: response regulator [Nitrospirae bacterium]|nr:response regulator [Nitrospirota bacterium]